jgi:hypothetical protein
VVGKRFSSGTGFAARRSILIGAAALIAVFVLEVGSADAAYHPFVRSFGSFASPQSVAVDPTGDVYVLDQSAGNVQKFDAEGDPVDFTALVSNTLTGAATPAESFSFSTGSAQLAVGNAAGPTAGDLYVADSAHDVVDVFSAAGGEYLGQISEANGAPLGEVCGVAVGPAGELYVSDFFVGIDRYIPTANPPSNADFDSQLGGFGHCQPAVDANGDVYAEDFGVLNKYAASQFGEAGTGTHVDAGPTNAAAVDPSDQDVYSANPGAIVQFTAGGESLGSFAAGKGTELRGLTVTGSGDIYIADSSAGNVLVYGPTPPPVAPTIEGESALPSQTEAVLSASVNPGNVGASYYFEYGETGGYGRVTPARRIPPDGEPVAVSATALGLTPGIGYHFRIVVTNTVDAIAGADQTFTSSAFPSGGTCPNEALRIGPSAALAECRAYEQVSPVEKAGGNVNLLINAQAAPSGAAASFASTTAFAGNTANALGNLYISRRGENGWFTEGVDPTQLNQTDILAAVSPASSEEFGTTLQTSKVALAPGAIEGGSNVYLRDNATGQRTTIASATGDRLFQQFKFNGTNSAYRGSTSDFGHLLVESSTALAAGATEGTENVFDYTAGHFVLASRLPGGEESESGSHAGYTEHPTYDQHLISTDGSRIFFTASSGGAGPVYMRHGGTTVPISVSHRSGPEDGTIQPVEFAGANADGTVVYFATELNLTDRSETHGRPTLYRYEVDNETLTDLTVDPTGPEGGFFNTVLGISEDGSYVYFTAKGALTEEAEEADFFSENIYVWHDQPGGGEIRYIGHTENESPPDRLVSPNGEYFAFSAYTAVTPEDVPSAHCPADPEISNPAERCSQVYEYDFPSGTLACVSCDGPGLGHSHLGGTDGSFSNHHGRSVLGDGTVFFNTPNPLLSRDTNGVGDVYSWKHGSLNLISTGTSAQESNFADATPNGTNVFLRTSQQLVSQDTDQSVDLYDARVDGGIAAQNPPPSPAACNGESCRGGLTQPPAEGQYGTATGAGLMPSACPAGTNALKGADRRAKKLSRQAAEAVGRKARHLRKRAKQERLKAKRLKANGRKCGGKR